MPWFRAEVKLRPLEARDALAVHTISQLAFDDLAQRRGRRGSGPPPDTGAVERHIALREHLAATDPDGGWVAERGGQIVGAGVALRRERLWGLSLLVVAPEHQGNGIGGELLGRTLAYADGAGAGIVLASEDPRAIRSYGRAGFALLPTLIAEGEVTGSLAPRDGVRAGDAGDLVATATEVDRAVRGAPHGEDLEVLLRHGAAALVIPGRGYCLHVTGRPQLLAAIDDDAATRLLSACLTEVPAGERTWIGFLTGAQAWAFDVALAAGLSLTPGGPVCVRGDIGPLAPYIPSGSLL